MPSPEGANVTGPSYRGAPSRPHRDTPAEPITFDLAGLPMALALEVAPRLRALAELDAPTPADRRAVAVLEALADALEAAATPPAA